MLRIDITEYNQKLEEIIRSFPAQLIITSEDFMRELIRAGKVDVAILPQTSAAERKLTHRAVQSVAGFLIVASATITSENQLLLDEFLLRINTTYNALNKNLLRLVAPKENADAILQLLKASCHTDVFVAESGDIVRFEAVTDYAAFYDILTKLHDCGARQISLIPIEKYY